MDSWSMHCPWYKLYPHQLYECVPLWRVSFSSSLVWDRVEKSESLIQSWVSFIQEIDQWYGECGLYLYSGVSLQ